MEYEIETCCELHPPQRCGPTRCPECGALGKPVPRLTVGSLLRPEARPRIPAGQDQFCFCRTPTCNVTYLREGEALFWKEDLSVPVHQKEPLDTAVPVCYCFGWTPDKLRAQIEASGKTTAVEEIKAQVKAGNCYCEVTNPQGACCLGNVTRVIQSILSERQP